MSPVKYIFGLNDIKLKYKKQKILAYFSKRKPEVITAECGEVSHHSK